MKNFNFDEISKLFRAYGLYNEGESMINLAVVVSKLFRAYGLYNIIISKVSIRLNLVSKLFRAYGLYNLCSLEGALILNPSGLFAIGFKKVDKNVFKL